MTSAPVRDPIADHLHTPQNAALLLIGYQPAQLAGVRSVDRDLLIKNAVSTVVGGALLRRGPLAQDRTPSPAHGGVTTAQAEASREQVR